KRKPLIPMSMRSFYLQVKESLPLTTNTVEGWHNILNHRIAKNSNPLFGLLKGPKLGQASNDDYLEKLFVGVPVKDNLKVKPFTARIAELVLKTSFDDEESVDKYLDQVSLLMLNC